MKTIKLNENLRPFFVGYEGENDARGFAFDYSAWSEEYGSGVLQMLLQRQGDADPYPVVLSAGENGTAIWTPSATDTAVRGSGEIQLIYTVDEVVAKTAVVRVLIDRSLGASGDPPDPYETWLEDLTELAADTQQNAQNAAGSAEDARTARATAEAAAVAAQDSERAAAGYATAAGNSADAASDSAEAASASAEQAAHLLDDLDAIFQESTGQGIEAVLVLIRELVLQILNRPELVGDTELSLDSENWVQNKVITAALGLKVDKAIGMGLTHNDFTDTLKDKLDGIATGATKVIVDSAMSDSSTNPVQNGVINTTLKDGTEATAEYHLGFYLDQDGNVCQVDN